MGAFSIVLQASVGTVFLLSALGKLTKPIVFKRALSQYKVLRNRTAVRDALFRVVPLAELTLAVTLLTRINRGVLAVASVAILLIPFTIGIAINASNKIRSSCGCGLIDSSTTYSAVGRNVALLLAITTAAFTEASVRSVDVAARNLVPSLGLAIVLAIPFLFLPALIDELLHQREHL